MNGCVYTAGGEFGCGRVPGPAPGAQLDRMPMPMPIDVVEGFDPSISSSSSSFPSPQAVQAADLDAAAKAQRDATNAMWLADGSMANVAGKAKVNLTAGAFKGDHTFVVMDSLGAEGLLGS